MHTNDILDTEKHKRKKKKTPFYLKEKKKKHLFIDLKLRPKYHDSMS